MNKYIFVVVFGSQQQQKRGWDFENVGFFLELDCQNQLQKEVLENIHANNSNKQKKSECSELE